MISDVSQLGLKYVSIVTCTHTNSQMSDAVITTTKHKKGGNSFIKGQFLFIIFKICINKRAYREISMKCKGTYRSRFRYM